MQKKNKRIALVLGGGGIKAAAFHVGVCLALQEKGFRFAGGSKQDVEKQKSQEALWIDTYVGSSAGAIISSYLAAGYPVKAIIKSFKMADHIKSKFDDSEHGNLSPLTYKDIFNVNTDGLSRFNPRSFFKKPLVVGGLEVLLKNGFKVNGLFSTNGIEEYFREKVLFSNRFEDLGVQLYLTATQLNHSRKVIFGNFEKELKEENIEWANYASISQAVAASAALPPVFAPYGIQNNSGKNIFFIDGEVRDTLSTHVAEDFGADIIISSYTIQPYHYNDEMGSLHQYGLPMIINQALYQVVNQKIARFRREKEKVREIPDIVEQFFKEHNLDLSLKQKFSSKLIQHFGHSENAEYVYIHPSPKNHEFFFMDHFSLNPEIMARIVRAGFISAVRSLRAHKF